MRAQAAVEYLSIVAISLAALLPLWYFVSTSTDSVKQDLRVGSARQAVFKLRDAADLAYAQGVPAEFLVEVNVPDGISSASLYANEIVLQISMGSRGTTDVFSVSIANLTGDISRMVYSPGLHLVRVKAQRGASGSTLVNVTD
ncbi:Uncharacterised protein [Candidatus Norongarragalina meridionalis]|nr:Uncharacterised protein [Candidatus Norongarragalina meridionalis]